MTTSAPMPLHTLPPSLVDALWRGIRANVGPLASVVLKGHPELGQVSPVVLVSTAMMAVVVEHGAPRKVHDTLLGARVVSCDLGHAWATLPPTPHGDVFLVGRAAARYLLEELGHEALALEALERLPALGMHRILCVVLGPARAISLEIDEPAQRPDRTLN